MDHVDSIFTGKGRQTLDITLSKLGLSGHFDFVVCGSDVPRSKPSPDGLEKIMETTGTDRNAIL